MPFTFSHPALILPLTRLKPGMISLTGLIIGSIAPDFEYFFRMEASSSYSHTVWGILYFDLPMTIGLSCLFHSIIKGPLLANMPFYFKVRSNTLVSYDFLSYLKQNKIAFTISAIIGSSSHIFWDAFTFAGGYFVQIIPILSTKIKIGDYGVGIYKLVQYGSTIVGGLIILMYIHFLPKGKNPFPDKINYSYWLLIVATILAVVYQPILTGFIINRVANYSVTFITGGLVGLVIVSLIFWLRNPAKYQPVSISDN